jgi:hypothetical protein
LKSMPWIVESGNTACDYSDFFQSSTSIFEDVVSGFQAL